MWQVLEEKSNEIICDNIVELIYEASSADCCAFWDIHIDTIIYLS